MQSNQSLCIAALRRSYRTEEATPSEVVNSVLSSLSGADEQNVWISRVDERALRRRARELTQQQSPEILDQKPLFGVPFAIKDNIDFADLPTTAGCEAYGYAPDKHATVVRRLIEAGALPVGKTNMDQFATGLVGTRSPYGACRNVFDDAHVSGGSSSGSGVAVAAGLVSFALGTDTAGSGRVPAAFNNVVGLKPTRGVVSTSGVVPACRSLDCVSVFAQTPRDALRVERVVAGYDSTDAYSRRRADEVELTVDSNRESFAFGVPRSGLKFFGDQAAATLFEKAVEQLSTIGGEPVPINFELFVDAGKLLYQGPWVAERYAALREFIESRPDAMLSVVRRIIERGANYSAVEVFTAMYELQEAKQRATDELEDVDFVVVPTTGTIYTREEVDAAPVERNSDLGYYTNFVNLLDLSAIAIPAGFRESGTPFGVTLFGDAFADATLASIGQHMCRERDVEPGAEGTHSEPVGAFESE
jgi:allophanate hydrolase